MVFDTKLGYDPEEWEECEEVEHFMVFGPFARYFLTFASIAFVYYFFRLLDENKNKGKQEEEPESVLKDVVSKEGFDEVTDKLQKVSQQLQENWTSSAANAEKLIQEADQYLRESVNDALNNGAAFVDGFSKTLPRIESSEIPDPRATEQHFAQTLNAVDDHLNNSLNRRKNDETKQSLPPQLPPSPFGVVTQRLVDPETGRNVEFTVDPSTGKFVALGGTYIDVRSGEQKIIPTGMELDPRTGLPFGVPLYVESTTGYVAPQLVRPVGGDATGNNVVLRSGDEPQKTREKRLSEQDEQALNDWDREKALLEADRIKKLMDTMAGGESSTDLSNSAKAFERLAPASHISFETSSVKPPVPPRADRHPERNHENAQRASNQQLLTNVRDSQLTDYDISDFQGYEGAEAPEAQTIQQPRNTGDSDDFVKINEPIYDYPPAAEPKTISPTEAAQLQELCEEYDLGLDLPGVSPPVKDPVVQKHHVQQQQHAPGGPNTAFHAASQYHPQQGFQPVPQQFHQEQYYQQPPQQYQQVPYQFVPQQYQSGPFQQPQQFQQSFQPQYQQTPPQHPLQRQDSASKIRNVPIAFKPTPQAARRPEEYHIPVQTTSEDPKNLATAELFVQDAIEYLGNQNISSGSGFVVEEEMLNEQGNNNKTKHQSVNDPTSKQVKTNDVYDRIDHDEHDDMTYAPEIRSVEIPPDQMSENSENLLDYFDKVANETAVQAAEFSQGGTLKKKTAQPQTSAQAPQILPAFGNRNASSSSINSGRSSDQYPYPPLRKQSSLCSVLGATSMQEVLLTINSLEDLSEAMRKAGLETTNMIFGIDYTASNKYQGEDSFGGRSLHTIHPNIKNPYQQVISILGRTLAPFAGHGNIGAYGFGDQKTGDWGVFSLNERGHSRTLEEVLKIYNEVTPTVALSGPTNFAPLIYQAMEICQKTREYHILVIIADGQVTNERATRRAIVQACQHPLSIIVVGVGDGPWDMMKVFDESLPKRPWDNFHFVEFHDIIKKTASEEEGDVKVAVQSLLEIPDQYRCVCELGLLNRSVPPRGSEIRRQLMHNPL